MDKKLIDYEGFEAYSQGVRDKYAIKKDIITPQERKQLQLHNEGYIQSSIEDISSLLYCLFINTAFFLREKRSGFFSFVDDLVFNADGTVKDKTELDKITKLELVKKYQQHAISKTYGVIIDKDSNNIGVDKLTDMNLKVYIPSHVFNVLWSEYDANQSMGFAFRSFVAKEKGKSLSANDYTDEEKLKVGRIPNNPKYTDTIPDLSGYAKKENIPTKISQLKNDKTFKTESEIQQMIGKASSLKKEVVTSLPTTGKDDVIYLVKDDKGKDNNNYLEYLWLNGKYELIGSTQVDLSGYAKLEDIVASKVIVIYELDKDFWNALQTDQNFIQATQRDVFTLVVFKGEQRFDLAIQAGFESALYYKGQIVGTVPIPCNSYDGFDKDIRKNTIQKTGSRVTCDMLSAYNKTIQTQLKEQKESALDKTKDKAVIDNHTDYNNDTLYTTPYFVQQAIGVQLPKYIESVEQGLNEELEKKLNTSDIQEFTQQELEEAFK